MEKTEKMKLNFKITGLFVKRLQLILLKMDITALLQ